MPARQITDAAHETDAVKTCQRTTIRKISKNSDVTSHKFTILQTSSKYVFAGKN